MESERHIHPYLQVLIEYADKNHSLSTEEFITLQTSRVMLSDLGGLPLVIADFNPALKMVAVIRPRDGLSIEFCPVDKSSIGIQHVVDLSREDLKAQQLENQSFWDRIFMKSEGEKVKFQVFNIGRYKDNLGNKYPPFQADMRMHAIKPGFYSTTFFKWSRGFIRGDFHTFDIEQDLVYGFTEIPRELRNLYKRWIKQDEGLITVSNLVINN